MKQHITVEQLKELDIKVLEKLFKECYYYDGIEDEEFWTEGRYIHTENLKCAFGNFSYSLCIGKMIEILEEDYKITIDGNYGPQGEANEHFKWAIVMYKKSLGTIYHQNHFNDSNLCDALWQAIKEVL